MINNLIYILIQSQIGAIRLSSSNTPFVITPSTLLYTPRPFILSAFHSPSQKLPSVHLYMPFPNLMPSTNSPSQQSSLLNLQTPFPCFLLFFHSPVYESPVYISRVPFPYLRSSTHRPKYLSPLQQRQDPSPLRIPFFQLPSYLSPFEYFIVPLPFLSSKLQSPLYQPSGLTIVPLPHFNPSLKSPSQVVIPPSFRYNIFPLPAGLSSLNSPSKCEPFPQITSPLPFFLPFLNTPRNLSLFLWIISASPLRIPRSQLPLMTTSGGIPTEQVPFPSHRSFFHQPSYFSPVLAQLYTPNPCFIPWYISPLYLSQLANKYWPSWKVVPAVLRLPENVSPLGNLKLKGCFEIIFNIYTNKLYKIQLIQYINLQEQIIKQSDYIGFQSVLQLCWNR